MAQSRPAEQRTQDGEKTFRSYTSEQGAAYAQGRQGYHPNLFRRIVDYHTSKGGQLGTVVDVGCGPGTATRALATAFNTAIGLDASKGMIATATTQGGVTAADQPIQFRESTAEGLDVEPLGIQDGTVDLITAATAAHWFDMSRFWPRAAQLLRPGGTVALWTGNFHEIHPSVPNADEMSLAMRAIEESELKQYMEPGNLMGRELYRTLPLPWTLETPVSAFSKQSFYRKEWGTPDGFNAEVKGEEFVSEAQKEYPLAFVEVALGTTSPVTRWREANPDKVGTAKDVLKLMTAEMARLLHAAGVPVGQERVKGKVTGVLLLVKKEV